MQRRAGFTLIEICIAIVILTVGLLGLGASTNRLLGPINQAELEFLALEAVEDRLSQMRLDPRYGQLDSIYGGTETNLPGLTGLSRVTTLTRTQTNMPAGGVLDFKTVVVRVSGGRLPTPVSRKLIIASQ